MVGCGALAIVGGNTPLKSDAALGDAIYCGIVTCRVGDADTSLIGGVGVIDCERSAIRISPHTLATCARIRSGEFHLIATDVLGLVGTSCISLCSHNESCEFVVFGIHTVTTAICVCIPNIASECVFAGGNEVRNIELAIIAGYALASLINFLADAIRVSNRELCILRYILNNPFALSILDMGHIAYACNFSFIATGGVKSFSAEGYNGGNYDGDKSFLFTFLALVAIIAIFNMPLELATVGNASHND